MKIYVNTTNAKVSEGFVIEGSTVTDALDNYFKDKTLKDIKYMYLYNTVSFGFSYPNVEILSPIAIIDENNKNSRELYYWFSKKIPNLEQLKVLI